MLINSLYYFTMAVILSLSILYIWNKLSIIKIDYKNSKFIIPYIFLCIVDTLNYLFINNFIKIFSVTIILMIFYYIIYKDKLKICIITPIYSQLIIMISELIYILFIVIVLKLDAETLTADYFGNIITNIAIALIAVGLINIKFVRSIYNFLLKVTDKIKERQLILVSLFLILAANIFTALMYYKINIVYLMITNTIVIAIFMIIIFVYFKANNNYIKISENYNNTLKSLKEYEDILNRYRISNHENKNQLLTIRGMLKNKKVTSYIDEIIENKIKDDEKLMFESLIIPEGGLRGLIYSKLLLMKENNIEYDLCVDKNIKTSELTNLKDELMLNICNIIGVYIDNAIEEVKKLDEKYIVIEFYKDDTLNIAITNNYVGTIDIDKLENKGYSTKGKGHGFGLSLAREIIEKNKNLENVKRISEDEFTQELKIRV